MATSSNSARQSKYGPHNAFDGLRVILPDPAASDQQVYPTVNAFDSLKIAPPTPASTYTASSSGTKHLPYDVFINHHGGDSKHTVAKAIYNSLHSTGLRVFLDKDELKLGDFFPKTLEEAMLSAELHIAIFSEHYAQSPWCLAELAFMVKTGTKIIPVFYYVDPSTLRWAIQGKGIYADAFSNYEMKRRYSSEQLQQWKWALHEASFFTGDIITKQEDEQRVVKNVVNCVLREMNKVPLEVAKHPVGIDEAVHNFEKIRLQSGGLIQIVGIWGMGGSGKTTLAKKIFNDRRSVMDRSSFLFDLRDAAGKGLMVEKQKRLLEDLDFKDESFDNVDIGKGILESRLRSVSVLIILDDVDHTDQFDALLPAREKLGQRSLIVVTTRELDVLIAWGISAVYEMRPLNSIHAKQLFCWHAFLQPTPLPGFEDLVEKFLNACKGLPLSLKVLGAQLYGRSRKDYWQSQLNKISRILPADIKWRLKVSYDALDDEEKEMFLDAACFFIGERKSVAIAIWDGSGWSGLHGWEKLFNKCLVEIEDGGEIRMHDHLRDLGREVANRQAPYRLWSPQQCIQIHSQQEAIQIRGLVNAIDDNCYLGQGNIRICTSLGERSVALSSLGLKVFVGHGDFINQELGEISGELVWFQCVEFKHRNLPSLKKLKILKIFSSWSLENLWEHDTDAPVHLKELVIEKCERLREFPRSIGCLKNLKKIIIRPYHLSWLSALPQEFCNLQSLEHVEIRSCANLSSLPRNFGELTNLKHLNLNGCTALKMLPDSFKKLTRLEHLNLENCGELIIKSDVVENMRKLRYLNLTWCKKLEELRLPEVASLTNLYLKGTGLKQLPSNIFHLTKLTELAIGGEFLETLPSSLGNSSPLNKIEVRLCKKLESLSDSLQHLKCLKDLVIYGSGVKCLSISFIHLQSLEITDTPISELSFGLGCMLKTISLWSTEVSKISISEDSCPFLETLRLGNNKDLRDVETLPATLKSVSASQCNVLKDIRGVRCLKKLEELKIENCTELDGLPCFAELVSLENFTLKGSSKVKKIAGIQVLQTLHLMKFELQKCIKFEKIESFRCLKSLEVLKITDCQGLEALPGLSEITSLRIIQLKKCHKMEKIEDLGGLRSLETLEISDYPELEKIEGLGGLRSLKTLKISDCPELDRLPSLDESTSLQYFDLKMCHKLKKIESLGSLTSLDQLNIIDCPQLDGLPSLEDLTSLQFFDLKMCHKLKKVEGLEGLRKLLRLTISDCPELERLPSLEELISLRYLDLRMCQKLKEIEGLERLENLEVHSCLNVPSIVNLEHCQRLERLVVVAKDRSDVEPYISNIQKWPSEVIICTRVAVPNVSILDYPEGGLDAMAELIKWLEDVSLTCFIIDCVYPYLNIHIDCGIRSFDTELAEGKWLWMGVSTQGPPGLRYDPDEIWAYSENNQSRVKVKVEDAWSVMGEEGSIVEAFRQIFQS
ncbi:LOW QUALITY PROTEIN: disease resistance protein RPV1 [Cryptomeria japonica]|uniref:LOW QUALITY PROTEIN: disease resistance protein RPV1 n=1 Tax=Cryptomeria japonica TaxID=3369 RepID=UPI0027DA5951|nr:LOW QUALITY PROTEIN: disease resistance protein RPV1 [Cryptomeria japonica]